MLQLYTYYEQPFFSTESASSCQVYPSEYAYQEYSVYRYESVSANCKNYPSGLYPKAGSEQYIHCNGTELKLADSDLGSEQYSRNDYYVWLNETRNHQLLFIFPMRVNLTTITLHYYHTGNRGLPRLRFWAVPDDFDVWDAPISTYTYADAAAVPPSKEPAGRRNVSINYNLIINTKKVLLFKFSSSFIFSISEVEFMQDSCSNIMQGSASTITHSDADSSYRSITTNSTSVSTPEVNNRKKIASEFKLVTS